MTNHTLNKKIIKQVANFRKIFTKPSYQSFKAVTLSLINYRHSKQADFAKIADKAISSLQYFFDQAKWSYTELNQARLNFLRNKGAYRDRVSDLAIFDGSQTIKDKDSSFGNLVEHIFDTKKKVSAKGFEWFAASIFTKEKQKYLLDIRLFFKR